MSANTPTVFVVDDDTSFLASVSRLLRASGLPALRPYGAISPRSMFNWRNVSLRIDQPRVGAF